MVSLETGYILVNDIGDINLKTWKMITPLGFRVKKPNMTREEVRQEFLKTPGAIESANKEAYRLGKEMGLPVIPYRACKDCHKENLPFYKVKNWVWLLAHDKGGWPHWDLTPHGLGMPGGELCWDCLEKRCGEAQPGFQLKWEHFCDSREFLHSSGLMMERTPLWLQPVKKENIQDQFIKWRENGL